MKHLSGIYKVINTTNGKCYIGSAVNLERRWYLHTWRLRKETHHSAHLQNAWNKYGEASFIFETLFYCEKKDLLFFEQRAIDTYKPEYNICQVAGSSLGRLASDETKRKKSEALRGEKNPMFGKVVTKETRDKLSNNFKGKMHTTETKQRMSEIHTKIHQLLQESTKTLIETFGLNDFCKKLGSNRCKTNNNVFYK